MPAASQIQPNQDDLFVEDWAIVPALDDSQDRVEFAKNAIDVNENVLTAEVIDAETIRVTVRKSGRELEDARRAEASEEIEDESPREPDESEGRTRRPSYRNGHPVR